MKSAKAIAESLLKSLNAQYDNKPDESDPHYTAGYLKWMCQEIINHPEWDLDKAHRWVGYVQGVMVSRCISTVVEERNRVREIPSIEIYASDGVSWMVGGKGDAV